MDSINEELRVAAESGDEAEVEALLLNSKCDPLSTDKYGMTPLMCAAYGGHEACFQLLLPVSDASTKNNHDWTALMYAAHGGYDSCVRLLLPVSDALAKDNENKTASEIASERGHFQSANFIDAYALTQSEKTALDSVITTVTPQKRNSLRV